jgi:hypothetical protein
VSSKHFSHSTQKKFNTNNVERKNLENLKSNTFEGVFGTCIQYGKNSIQNPDLVHTQKSEK